MLYPYFPFSLGRQAHEQFLISSPYGEHIVNRDAAAILQMCNGSRSLDDIAARLQARYDFSNASFVAKAETFIDSLSLKGLVWIKEKPMRWFNPPPPQTIFWEVTSRCNLQCLHCVVSAGENTADDLSTERCLQLIDDWAAFGVQDITFSGGEPLLREDLFQLALAAKQKNLSISLASNGTLITRDVARQCKALDMDVQISLDGSTADIYGRVRGRKEAFDDVMEGIRNTLSEGVNLTIGTVLTKNNVDDIPELLKLVQRMNIPYFRLIPFIPSGRGQHNRDLELDPLQVKKISEDLAAQRKMWAFTILPLEFELTFSAPSGEQPDMTRPSECGGAVHYCTVTPTGEVLPCHYFEGVVTDSVRNRSFSDIWRNSRFLNYFRSIEVGDIKGYCHECEWLSTCRGGCKAANFSHRDLFQSNAHCWVVRENQR
jgi:radical SAM protein with 4Fe4S-binding SPASM domain